MPHENCVVFFSSLIPLYEVYHQWQYLCSKAVSSALFRWIKMRKCTGPNIQHSNISPGSRMGTVMTTPWSMASTCQLNCVEVVRKVSRPVKVYASPQYTYAKQPSASLLEGVALQRSMALPVGRGTSERWNRVTSSSLVQKKLQSHWILPWMSSLTIITTGGVMVTAVQNERWWFHWVLKYVPYFF